MKRTNKVVSRPEVAASPVAMAVKAGLSQPQKKLPAWLFYDAEGSRLFDEITVLPEYYLTRTELGILAKHAAEIIEAAGERLALVELGAGSAEKTRVLIRALLARQQQAAYYPIDVSATALAGAAASLRSEFEDLTVTPVVSDYARAVQKILMLQGRKLVMFIGSSIGNYEPQEAVALLTQVRQAMRTGDAFLLGADMVKPEAMLVAAYDDATGVTAAFNLNVLARINRELGGNFDLNAFRHVALWNQAQKRMEMHLESLRTQAVEIPGAAMTAQFLIGERIHTENSYKYLPKQIASLLGAAGFQPERSWYDEKRWFGVHLARAK